MKIVNLKVERIKRIKAVEVDLTGKPAVVKIQGKNGNGKTSLIDAIMYGLAGDRALPQVPVRKGHEHGDIFIDLGEITVTKTIPADGKAKLVVKSAAGVPQMKPQDILNSLVGNLTFDPTAFRDMKPVDQVSLLKKLVGLDFTELDQEKAATTQSRLEVGRVVKQMQGQLDGMPLHEDAPAEPESMAALAEEMKLASAHNKAIDKLKEQHGTIRGNRNARLVEISELEDLISKYRLMLQEDEVKLADLETKIEGSARKDEEALRQRIVSIEIVNSNVAANKARAAVKAQLEAQERKYQECSSALTEIEDCKAAQLAKAKMPIKTLSFSDTGVLVAGVPFEQASAAEQLRVSLAMGMALNPKLRVLMVRNGSLLDQTSMRIVSEMCEAQDFQLFVEIVTDGESDDTALVIEDGQLKE